MSLQQLPTAALRGHSDRPAGIERRLIGGLVMTLEPLTDGRTDGRTRSVNRSEQPALNIVELARVTNVSRAV